MLSDPPAPDVLRSLGIHADETRVIQTAEVWWRVHRIIGGHVLAWNAFRTYGPLLRFDPHALPRGDDPDHGVWYGASTPDAALGEAFQVDRTIDRELNSPYLTGLSFSRPLTVLDLATDSAGAWATRVGGTRFCRSQVLKTRSSEELRPGTPIFLPSRSAGLAIFSAPHSPVSHGPAVSASFLLSMSVPALARAAR